MTKSTTFSIENNNVHKCYYFCIVVITVSLFIDFIYPFLFLRFSNYINHIIIIIIYFISAENEVAVI